MNGACHFGCLTGPVILGWELMLCQIESQKGRDARMVFEVDFGSYDRFLCSIS